MLVSFSEVAKSYGADVIFERVSLNIDKGDKIALIGTNGAGKSTLLNMISGDLDADKGEIYRANGLKIGYFRQNSGLNLNASIAEEMRSALSRVYELEALLLKAGERLGEIVDHDSSDYHAAKEQYDRLQAEYEARDGYGADVRINTILTGMGFGSFDRSTVISTLSGGERTRLALAKLLLESPALLILDEATNHLDFRMLMWLEGYLSSFRGAVIAVSHDRYFLDRVTNQTWEVEEKNIITYPASYSKFLLLKAERLERMQKEYDFRMAEIARLQDYHDRNIVRATTASSARSRLRMIEHLEEAPPPAMPPKPPFFKFETTLKPVKDVLKVQDLSLTVGEAPSTKTLFEQLDLHITRGEKVAIIGENGVGKSSLLKALVGKLSPQEGEVEWGRNVKLAYFDQEDGDLSMGKTALDELWDRHPTMYEQDVRNLLGSLRLTKEDVYKKVGVLSGGERAKLKLGILTLQHGNVMVMDEPTNHLDIMAKEALDKALFEYDGTLLVVSHDRYFLNRLPTRIIEVFSDRVVSFSGGFDAYIQSGEGQKPEPVKEKPEAAPSANTYHRSKKQRSEEAAAKRRMVQLEQEIHETEEQITRLEQKLGDPAYASDYQVLADTAKELDDTRLLLEGLYEEWEASLG